VTTPTVHTIQLDQFRPGRWRSSCSCGKYKSSGYSYKGSAEGAWESHVRSKTRGTT
jgi:hypothetical protein